MKYLIVGTGGVGGSIAAFLALAGKQVECIARGDALRAIRSRGLLLRSTRQGTHTLRIPAFTAEEYSGSPDVIFVTVKGYSLKSVAPLIERLASPSTIVIPVLNVYGTGPRLKAYAPSACVLDGCIYIVGFKSGVGEITQMGSVFHLVMGIPRGVTVPAGMMEAVKADLEQSGIDVTLSDDIDRDTFVKWSFISAMALTGAYFDCPMGPLQHPGPERDLFTALTRESTALGLAMGIDIPHDQTAHHLGVIDALAPESTASLQKDLARGASSEIEGMLFQMMDMARLHGVPIPAYERVSEKFAHLRR